MEISICIVSKNRKEELRKTLAILSNLITFDQQEILVFLDGCSDGSEELKEVFPQCKWFGKSKSIGTSPARQFIFEKVEGKIIVGFDDDAHPLQPDFIFRIEQLFNQFPKVAVLAFEEIKGIFSSDQEALQKHVEHQQFLCNSFVGCGYAIRKEAYQETAGFPQWMDIYGEESCVSIQLIDLGYDILYTSEVSVNHRVNRKKRKTDGGNVFRFERQLCHLALYFLMYYPSALLFKKWTRLWYHNFRKYALTDWKFFKAYIRGTGCFLRNFFHLLSERKPVSRATIKKINALPHPKYG